MSHEMIFSPEAQQDYYNAYFWYEGQKEGLGQRFREAVTMVRKKIEAHPFAYQIRYKDHRIAYTDPFGYGLHYIITGKTVEVVGLHHQKDDPTKWTNRD